MTRAQSFWAIVLIFCCAFSTGQAATLAVPSQYPTIAEALAAAQPGDVVKVAPGRYYEHGLSLNEGITLTGQGETPAQTVIDGQQLGRILQAEYLDSVAFIQNLTFTNGHAQIDEGYADSGGAIFSNSGTLRILNCRFIDNRAEASGGAIRCMMTSPLIINCYFEGNIAGKGGGALDCSYQASPIIQNSQFIGNSASYGGAVACRGASQAQFSDCRFDQNFTDGEASQGGAVISFFWGEPKFTQCTFTRNTAETGGGLFVDEISPAHLTGCTVTANAAFSEGAGIYSENASSEITNSIIAFNDGNGLLSQGDRSPQITCTNIYGNSGGDWFGDIADQIDGPGNMSADPLFCPTDLDGYYTFNLQSDSPCAQINGACADMGAWPVGCDESTDMVDLTLFTAKVVEGVPLIIWEVTGDRPPTTFRLARTSREAPQTEVNVAYTMDDEGRYHAEDTEFKPVQGVHFLYRLYLVFEGGQEVLLGTVSLGSPSPSFELQDLRAHPNPFNPQTEIQFRLVSPQKVQVDLYGIDGRKVRTLLDETLSAGVQSLTWNGLDDFGRVVSSGSYFVMVKGEGKPQVIKVMLLK